ncbi:MAG: hypothetical protein A2293_03690 [Elusimicrobia bacterium RIFOXYB2_FULL_49_7]|nr:MAG: hypothetical protein A2293_03690 [Elusimicrobia bacterium RIFOXYB2_FULL_49_7]
MGIVRKPESVKLFAGIIAESNKAIENLTRILTVRWGEIDVESKSIQFDFTSYYEREMGKNLIRKWVGFAKLINPGEIAGIKTETNNIEQETAVSEKRRINIDPGYLALSKVVLASTKDFSHRIYLDKGIYAEITLLYRDKEFIPLAWTYSDYQSETATSFFKNLRQQYHRQLLFLKED